MTSSKNNDAVASRHFSALQISGVNKMGTILVPGDSEFPSFSDSGCARNLDRILDYMPPSDRKDLGLLMLIFALLPVFLIAIFLRVLEWGDRAPGALGSQLRFIRLGLRGLVVSLYYGEQQILDKMQYEVNVYTADLPS